MTDVITIAKKRRAMLVAEIRKLDDFIRMGEALEKFAQRRAAPAVTKPEAAEIVSRAAPRENVAPARPVDRDPEANDQFHFSAPTPAPVSEDPLVLVNPQPRDAIWVDIHVGQKMRQRRWMIGMSRHQLARRTGIEAEQILKFEKGAVKIGPSRMWDIAAVLEVPMSYFFEGIDGQAADAADARSEVLNTREAMAVASGGAPGRTASAS